MVSLAIKPALQLVYGQLGDQVFYFAEQPVRQLAHSEPEHCMSIVIELMMNACTLAIASNFQNIRRGFPLSKLRISATIT